MSRPLLTLAAVGALFTLGLAASAQVSVHDNFGPGDSFNTASGLREVGPDAQISFTGLENSIGMGFRPAVSGTLSDITVAIRHSLGTNDAHLFLSDGAGGIPGVTLETFTLTNLPATDSFTPETLTSALHPLLTAGTQYYLYEQEPGDEANAWLYNNQGEIGGLIVSGDNLHYSASNDAPAGAYRVRVSLSAATTPEPGAFALFVACGLSGAWLLLRRLHGNRNTRARAYARKGRSV